MKKLAIALAVCGLSISSPAMAKTFVGVLWPMFGPLPAAGLVELVGELKMMPDVEVRTYLHQSWPALVEDIDRQSEGTHTIVVGYSLGANSSVFVANKAKYVDLIIALQPSVFSWNPPVRGKVGRMIEIYNPNPWMTFGGMGSKKLVGGNIEYIANNDSHPGAQFSPRFRSLVKREIAKFTAQDRVEIAQANAPKPIRFAQLQPASALSYAQERPARPQNDAAVKEQPAVAQERAPQPETRAKPLDVAQAPLKQPPRELSVIAQQNAPRPATPAKPLDMTQASSSERSRNQTAFLDSLSSSVNSGDLLAQPRLTAEAMKRYAERTYPRAPAAGRIATAAD